MNSPKKVKKYNTSSPAGMQEYMPQRAEELNHIKTKIKKVFDKWGYRPIITPTLEYYENLKVGIGEKQKKKLYRLIDREGSILALRPELTAPIARTVGRNVRDLNFPLRYYYSGPVFRHDESQEGKSREIYQQGLELIGSNIGADAEVITIAIESLLSCGVEDFQIDIGHVGYIEGLLDYYHFSSSTKREIKKHLINRNIVGLRRYLEKLEKDFDLDQFEDYLFLRGNREVLEKISHFRQKPIKKAYRELEQLYDFVDKLSLSGYLNFDLSLLRNFDYYTGVVFEAFATELGYLLCGGGRYDNLIQKYSNYQLPAVGFAVGLERLMLVRRRNKDIINKKRVVTHLIYHKSLRREGLELLKFLQNKGKNVMRSECKINKKLNEKEIINKCKGNGIKEIYTLMKNEGNNKMVKKYLIQDKKVITNEYVWEELICQD